MLILGRKVDQRTIITVPPSDTPTVIVQTIVDIRGDKVRDGWEAPEAVKINREEIEGEKV